MNNYTRRGLKRKLLIVTISYIAVVAVILLIVRLFWVKDWAQLREILSLPQAWISLLAILIFYLILQTILQVSPSGKTARAMAEMLDPVGRICWVLGIITILVAAFAPALEPTLQLSLTALGLAMFGIGTGFIGLSVARKSDERMVAMANLEFYEKIAVIEAYISDIYGSDLRKQTSAEEEERRKRIFGAHADRIYHDIKGAKQLNKYVDPEIKNKLKKEIDRLKNLASKDPQKYKELIENLTKLQEEEQ